MAVMYHVTSVTSWLFYFFLLNDLHKVTAVHFSWQYAWNLPKVIWDILDKLLLKQKFKRDFL